MTVKMPLLITVNGTAVPDPFGPGFSSDLGRILRDPWIPMAAQCWGSETFRYKIWWQPVGYPAATFPMGTSETVGQVETNRLIIDVHEPGYPLFLSGYSQGADIIAKVVRDDIMSPHGVHHDRLSDLERGGVLQFGDPHRCPGIARGNDLAGFPVPKKLDGQTTGGIAGPDVLRPEQTPDWYLSCANDGDLYASCPIGDDPWGSEIPVLGIGGEAEVGVTETAIYNMVQKFTFSSFLKFLARFPHLVADAEAIANGMGFVAAQLGPHGDYAKYEPAIIDWMLSRI